MNHTLLARLRKLEATAAPPRTLVCRIGVLKPLPAGFLGERHIVVVKQAPPADKTQWCEFEERPGPALPGSNDDVPRIYMSETEANI